MTVFKRSLAMLVTVLMLFFAFAGCGSKEETKTDATEQATAVETVAETVAETEAEKADENADDGIITEDEAIELVKAEMGDDFSYIPADELEEKDGKEYYVIYVKKLLEQGNLTTMATYYVSTDGSEVFDKDAVDFYGEYVKTGDISDVTFTVNEDNSFEMTTVGEVNQTVSGKFEFGVTDSDAVVKLLLYPNKIITEDNGEEVEEEVSDRDGVAVIENGKLTLEMESQETVFTKK